MNKLKSYIIGAVAVLALGGGFTSCQDHFDEPAMSVDGPVATMTPNTTIAELKAWMWNTELNYCDTVYTRDYFMGQTNDPWSGEHVIISGRVISSDYAGNCFKYIVLQDESGALNISINSYNLYLDYRRGQEVVVDLTGLFAGKYRGLFQIGFPSWNSSNNGYETSFLAPELFNSHREFNGWPEIEKIDTIVISSFNDLGVSPSELQKWQSQLIRINNVTFSQSSDAAAEGITTLSTYHSSGVSQTITDSEGYTGAVRTSGYANFWNMELPEGPVDVVLIASYYGSNESNAAWQYTLINAESIIFDSTVPQGTKDNPYTIEEAIILQADPSKTTTAWVQGYLVGTVAPEVTEVNSDDDVEWGDTPILGNTMVLAPTQDCTDITKCLVLELPQNTSIYKQSILANPSNYKKLFAVRGVFQSVMDTYGVVTPGTSNDYLIDGQAPDGGGLSAGDGTQANPYNVAQVLALGSGSGVQAYVNGYIVGYIPGMYLSEAVFSNTGEVSATNLILADTPECTDVNKCIPVQLPSGSIRSAMNLKDNPQNLGAVMLAQGTVTAYFGAAGLKDLTYAALLTEGTGGNPGGGGDDTPSTPGGKPGTETFTSGIGLPEAAANAPSTATNYTSKATGITYNIMGCYISTYNNSSYLMINGKNYSGAYIQFSLAFNCAEIQMVTSGACSPNAASTVNVYANGTKIGNYPANVQNSTVTVSIPAEYQAAGTVYKVESGSDSYNQQFVSFTYLENGSGGGSTGGGDTPAVPDGTITVAEALSLIAGGYTGEATVRGVISSVGSYNSTYGQVTYNIVDEGKTDELQIYSGFWLNGEKFTSASQLEKGATVVVKGNLKNYNGTPEMDMRSVILSYTPPTGGSTGGGDNTGGGSDTPTTPGGTVVAFVADGATYSGSGDVVTLSGTVANNSYTASGVCTLSFVKNNNNDSNVNNGQVRWYKNDGITITPAAGVTITGVTINSVNNYSAEDHITPSAGWSFDGLVATWSGSTTSTLSFANDNQIRFTYIEVTYSK